MCGPSPPKPPDYAAAAEAEGEASRQNIEQQTWANRPNQVNPWGTVNWTNESVWDPTTQQNINQWTQNTQLNPEAQAALDSQMALQQGRSDLAGGMMSDVAQDYGTRMNFDQYGNPIGMGDMDRMSGAGQGINTDMGNLGKANTNVRRSFDFDDPGLEGQNLEKNLDYSQAPDVNSPEWTREAAEQSVYDRGASRLDPQIAQEGQALEVKLRSQGLNPGDEAYDAQMNNFERRKTDAYDALQAQAMKEGAGQAESMFGMESQYRDQSTGEEDRMKQYRNQALQGQFGIDAQRQAQMYDQAYQTGMFGQQGDIASGQMGLQGRGQDLQQMIAQGQLGLQGQNQNWAQQMQQGTYNQNLGFRENALQNQLRTQGMNEDMQQRAYRLNEMNALMSGQQVNAPQFQQFNNAGVAQTPQYLQAAGMTGQHNQANFSAEQAMMNSMIGGAAGMAGMFASDRRLKTNIKKIGEINSSNWYEFDYIWGEHAIGVMADEVPWAAFEHPSGYLMVDYSKV